VSRADQAQIDRHGPSAAERQHLALLQHAQQCGLRRRRQVADLVEHERATMGGPDQPQPILRRTGERALAVAEQLGLQQRARQCPTVERNEGAVTAGVSMHVARGELLARAALAEDHDRHARARNLPQPREAVLELR
jgi:hypothetical protein